MSSHYSPDPAALPVGTPFTRQLSQRDLSLQVPINYVTTPGVSLTPACFAHKQYEDGPTAKCFSNLLAVGFARFEIDLYWDVTRHVWSLCPVELGPVISPSRGTSTSTSTTASPVTRASDLEKLLSVWLRRDGVAKAQSSQSIQLSTSSLTRIQTQTSSPNSPSTTAQTPPIAGGTTTTQSASSSALAGTISHIGPFSCTSSVNLDLLANVLSGHLDSTQNYFNATVKYLSLNLHAAAPASNPTGSGVTPSESDLPRGHNLLSSVLLRQLSTYLYTPNDLQNERADLNNSQSWFGRPTTYEPDTSYYEIHSINGHSLTSDGWPSESFVEMGFAKRLLAGYERVEPQMQRYNFTADAATIFARNYIQDARPVTLNSAGRVESGCFYHDGVYSISGVNSSWATSAESIPTSDGMRTLEHTLTAVQGLLACGISPILNETLEGVTANQDFGPYNDYVQSAIWSWALGEPLNATEIVRGSSGNRRCAVLSSSSGEWYAEDCRRAHYSACRKANETYEWSISNSATGYDSAEVPCPDGTEFSVPRTALENTYLVHKWRQTAANMKRSSDDQLLWLNFNDLDATACWVMGQNTTCPYLPSRSNEAQIVVPVVAAVIVFAVATLTIFVKCAANRQQSKRRKRRTDDLGEYEGVPS